METKVKRKSGNPNGRPKIDNVAQSDQFQFRCNPGTREVFQSYADNLSLNQTEMFYRMVHHLSGHGQFIDWYVKQPEMMEHVEKNKEWIESWKMVSKCCENMLLMNKGRVKQVVEKPIDTKVVKQVADALYEHFQKKG